MEVSKSHVSVGLACKILKLKNIRTTAFSINYDQGVVQLHFSFSQTVNLSIPGVPNNTCLPALATQCYPV